MDAMARDDASIGRNSLPSSSSLTQMARPFGAWRRAAVAPLDRSASKGHGNATSLAAGSDAILLGTARGALARYDLRNEAETTSQDVWTGPSRVRKVFCDPTGVHAVVTSDQEGRNPSTHHVCHTKAKRARALPRLKGQVITAVAWNRKSLGRGASTSFVMGNAKGAIYECVVDDPGGSGTGNGVTRREKVTVKQVGMLNGHPCSIQGIHLETFDDGKQVCAIVVTSTRLYVFQGGPTLDQVFAGEEHFVEMPGELLVNGMPHSELHVSLTKNKTADRLVWLTGDGLYCGRFGVGKSKGELRGGSMEAFVTDQKLIPYPFLGDQAREDERPPQTPISAAVTEFHYLLLYQDRILALNRVSEELIFDEYFNQGLVALVRDEVTGAVYSFNESTIFEIILYDEGQDMWEIYLRRKEWYLAIQHCRTQSQKDAVYNKQAEEAFAKGDLEASAALWARCSHVAGPRFEEVTLRLIRTGDRGALSTYLLRKLDNLPRSERPQRTMLATWLLELYLDAAYQEELKIPPGELSTPTSRAAVEELKDFMMDQKDDLDDGTTLNLLAGYGRIEELVYYATARAMYDVACMHMIQEGNAKRAIAVLRHPEVSPDLWYKFGPDLFLLSPKETVDAWLVMGKHLDPKHLLPALLVSEKQSKKPGARTTEQELEAQRYLEVVIFRHKCKDVAVHNLMLQLLTREDAETNLLRYLSNAVQPNGEPYYDIQYALRLCLERARLRSCCHLYATQGMFQEAVSLALKVDLELAKSVAEMPVDDEGMRRKLWLMVAKHVIQLESEGTTRDQVCNVVSFLKETDGLLKLEDILPFFPDTVLIDDLKGAVGDALEEYSLKIEELKREMDSATKEAEVIRKDLRELPGRFVEVTPETRCSSCNKTMLCPGPTAVRASSTDGLACHPFFVFPCTHTFHEGCLLQDVLEKQSGEVRARLERMQEELARDSKEFAQLQRQYMQLPAGLSSMGATIPDGEEELEEVSRKIERNQIQVNELISSACPYCSVLMVGTLTRPLVGPEDRKELEEWAI